MNQYRAQQDHRKDTVGACLLFAICLMCFSLLFLGPHHIIEGRILSLRGGMSRHNPFSDTTAADKIDLLLEESTTTTDATATKTTTTILNE
mmetsp:Transcript_12015/g.17613  ORF Transcript_12015/g.17613 Transcript_12015/m.17613 type:complete len:91 (-) Transcript_12015:198-470(-)